MQCKVCGAEMVKGRLVSSSWAHFVIDDGTVEYEGKAVESFRVQDSGFWRSMVECCHTESYYCPDCKGVVTCGGKIKENKTLYRKSPLLVQRALLCFVIQMRSLTLAFLPTRSRR